MTRGLPITNRIALAEILRDAADVVERRVLADVDQIRGPGQCGRRSCLQGRPLEPSVAPHWLALSIFDLERAFSFGLPLHSFSAGPSYKLRRGPTNAATADVYGRCPRTRPVFSWTKLSVFSTLSPDSFLRTRDNIKSRAHASGTSGRRGLETILYGWVCGRTDNT